MVKQKDLDMRAWTELLSKDQHFDWGYLIVIIRHKLMLMEDWYRSDAPYCEGATDKADQMAAAIKCCDELMESDTISAPLALSSLCKILESSMLDWWD